MLGQTSSKLVRQSMFDEGEIMNNKSMKMEIVVFLYIRNIEVRPVKSGDEYHHSEQIQVKNTFDQHLGLILVLILETFACQILHEYIFATMFSMTKLSHLDQENFKDLEFWIIDRTDCSHVFKCCTNLISVQEILVRTQH